MKFSKFLFSLPTYLPTDHKRRLYRLEVTSQEIELLAIKDFVQRVCDAAGCTTKETSNTKLAIDEACSNIIRHAYQGKPDGKISLEMGIGLSDLKIKITDYGKSFDFKGVRDPDLNHYVDIGKKGGLGIWLIKKIMTRVVYKAHSDHNDLILFLRFSKAPPKELGLKKGAVSASTKFTLGSVSLVAILFPSAYFFISYQQEAIVSKAQRDNLSLVVQTIATEAGSAVERKSDLELDKLIRDVLRSGTGQALSYAYIVGSEGKYLAHSDLSKLFTNYKPAPGVKSIHSPGVRSFHVTTPDGFLTEYVSPIYYHGQWVGEVHTGVSDAALKQLSEGARSRFLQLILWLSLVSIAGLFFLSRIVVQPFQKVLEGVRAISTGDLNAKIDLDSQDEFGQLANIFNEMTVRIQDSQKGMMEQERLQKEMQVAQEIQHTLLPAEFPQIEGYEIGATYRSAKEVGGDYYDFFWVDPSTLGIVVADVSGKGVPGSMVMTMIRTAMRLEARGNKSASDVLAKVNSHVTGDMKKGMFVTMFYIVLDSRNRSINFASAGHNPMILYRGETDEVYFLKPKGFPVGIDLPEEDMFRNNIALQKVSLQQNDMLVIYTDGITEAMDTEDKQFGEDRLVQVIKENSHLTPSEFVEKLNESIAQFTRGAEQHDDITVVAIKEKMKAENVVFKFRKKLIDLVEKKGMAVAEACRQMNISPNTYYRIKKIFDEKGKQGLKPATSKKRAILRELSVPQKQAVFNIIREHPEYGLRRIVETLRKSSNPPMKVDPGVVSEFLKRKGLTSLEERKSFGVNQVDTV
jgi:serine phosphatase RsbU (regulator of sigma subunit)/anti-sigma regulatory factor (Ser/Thr protein kinase)/transposase